VCFSATASLTAGAALSTVGVVTIKAAPRRAVLPAAAVPLLFGVQQLIEGLNWLALGSGAASLNAVMTYGYSLFAFVLWPVLIPLAVRLVEPARTRRRALGACVLAGVAVGGYLLYAHTVTPVTSHIVNHSIVYENSHFLGAVVLGMYFLATIGSLLLSSKRIINVFGALVFVAALTAYGVKAAAFVSVWCFLAAILSFVIYGYIRSERTEARIFARPRPIRCSPRRLRSRSSSTGGL
jgi:hypothetical protein